MGWYRMPLLTTLAVLVILVHSEEIERDERHRVSPRLADTGEIDYDQSWRVVESQLTMRPPPQRNDWDHTPSQELPKHRRPGRKRYRRPQIILEEDEATHRIPHFDETLDPYEEKEQESYDSSNSPRRRLKKIVNRNVYRDSDQEVQRPSRRRGHRRRRPAYTDPPQTTTDLLFPEPIEQQADLEPEETYAKNNHYEEKDLEHHHKEQTNEDQNDQIDKWFEREIDKTFGDFGKEYSSSPTNLNIESGEFIVKHEPGASESLTDKKRNVHYEFNEKLNERQEKVSFSTEFPKSEEIKEEISSNATPLKEFLKQSGGSSLSEMLQRKNLSLSDLLSGKQTAIQALQTEALTQSNGNKISRGNEGSIQNGTKEIKTPEQQFHFQSTENKTMEKEIVTDRTSLFINGSSNKEGQNMRNNNSKSEHTEKKRQENTTEISRPIMDDKITRRKLLRPGTRRRPKIRIPIRNNTTTKTYIKQIQTDPTIRTESTTPLISVKETDNLIETDINENKDNINKTNDKNVKKYIEPTTTEAFNLENTQVYASTESDSTTTNYLPATTTQTGKSTNTNPTEKQISTTEMAKHVNITEKLRTHIRPRLLVTNSELRKQILNNRLKRKRLRQKEPGADNADESINNALTINNLGSASEIISKIEKPEVQIMTHINTHINSTELPEGSTMRETNAKSDKKRISTYTTIRNEINVSKSPITTITEDTAKNEIEEILSDSQTRVRLSKILVDRNMTLKELVAHRERGSSQVHLADIFQNASHELSPPKPFLSKSSIEPISKEIYPLRALLEANLHDTPVQSATSKAYHNGLPNIPLMMNFGNNVNENGEKLGMASIHNKFHNHSPIDKHGIKQDSEGGTYFTSVMSVNISHDARESRKLDENSALNSLKEILSTIHKDLMNTTQKHKEDIPQINQNSPLEQDQDGDGLIILEDLQHISNGFSSEMMQTSNEEVDKKLQGNTKMSETNSQFSDKIFNKTKSVTVVTAALVALMMMLFLLTYMGCKWQQKRNMLRDRDSFNRGRVNTPVFENRKSAKNSSTRSISPMLSTSNVYNMSTIDSRNGKESPEYMWDSLRKPFQ